MNDEKERRVYYQNIAYAVCAALDEIDGNHVSKGTGIVCGTLGSPSTEVQARMKRLVEEVQLMRAVIDGVQDRLERIVCTEGEDRGVILLSSESPTHPEKIGGRTVQVYDYENFSPLGDALISLHDLTRTSEQVGKSNE